MEDHPNRELLELVTILQANNEAMLRNEQAVGLAIVQLERLTLAKLRVIEGIKTQLTGIDACGRL